MRAGKTFLFLFNTSWRVESCTVLQQFWRARSQLLQEREWIVQRFGSSRFHWLAAEELWHSHVYELRRKKSTRNEYNEIDFEVRETKHKERDDDQHGS
jgi:hypothetical protein